MSIRIEDLAKMDFRSVTVAGGKRISPTSPGEMLRDEFLKPMGLTNYRLARRSMCRRSASVTSLRASGASRRIRICDCAASWAHRWLVVAASGRL